MQTFFVHKKHNLFTRLPRAALQPFSASLNLPSLPAETHSGNNFAIFAMPISWVSACGCNSTQPLFVNPLIMSLQPRGLAHVVENMLKNIIFIALFFLLSTSCSTVKPAASRQAATTSQSSPSSSGSIEFINNIAINSDGQQDKTGSSITTLNKKTSETDGLL